MYQPPNQIVQKDFCRARMFIRAAGRLQKSESALKHEVEATLSDLWVWQSGHLLNSQISGETSIKGSSCIKKSTILIPQGLSLIYIYQLYIYQLLVIVIFEAANNYNVTDFMQAFLIRAKSKVLFLLVCTSGC